MRRFGVDTRYGPKYQPNFHRQEYPDRAYNGVVGVSSGRFPAGKACQLIFAYPI